MEKGQEKRIRAIRIELAKKGLRINDLTEIMRKRHPELKVAASHVSMALSGKYKSFLTKIEKALEEKDYERM